MVNKNNKQVVLYKQNNTVARRRKRNSNRVVNSVNNQLTRTVTPRPSPTLKLPKPHRINRVKGYVPSKDSLAFLRAAFAPVDFPQLAVEGVPDSFTGPTVVKQHSYVGSINLDAGTTINLLCCPTPGVAFWRTTGLVTTDWTPEYFGDFDTCFPDVGKGRDTVFSQFRYIGACMELRPTSSIVSNAGMITAARVPITVSERQVLTDDVSGGDTALALGAQVRHIDLRPASEAGYTQAACYAAHVNDGMYTVSLNDGNWQLEPIWTGEDAIPPAKLKSFKDGAVSDVEYLCLNGRLLTTSHRIVGFGHLNSIACKITATSAVTFTIIVRAIVEYVPDPYSMVYNMARPSPPYDPNALALYSAAASTLPVAVPYSQNAGFWAEVWNFFKKLLGGVATIAPGFGPVGEAVGLTAGAINAVGAAIQSVL